MSRTILKFSTIIFTSLVLRNALLVTALPVARVPDASTSVGNVNGTAVGGSPPTTQINLNGGTGDGEYSLENSNERPSLNQRF
jgi:hypothetical protein